MAPTLNRRSFLRGAALIAAGVVAADQLELVERVGWRRRLFPGWSPLPRLYGDGIHDDTAALQALFDQSRTFRLPHGRYRVTGRIALLKDDHDADLDGGTLVFENPDASLYVRGCLRNASVALGYCNLPMIK